MRRIHFFLSVLFLLETTSCMTEDYSKMLESLYSHTVPLITSTDLASDLYQIPDIILLDTRSEEEYQVSHIKYARYIDYEEFNEINVADIPLDTDIVVYCSVGYRSEKIGEQLLEMGYTNVKNLYGGIFQWKNDGFDVINENSIVTDSVHTYNKKWSKWLKKGIKVY